MLFWVLIALIPATIVVVTIINYRRTSDLRRFSAFRFRVRFWPAFGWGFVWGLLASAVSGLLIGAVLIPVTLGSASQVVASTHDTRELVSLQTSQQGRISGGRYYLGSGLINGSSGTGYTYMYSAKDGNGSTYFQLDNALASDSKVYTLPDNSDQKPTVAIDSAKWEKANKWLLPWAYDAGTGYAYTFYVPKDSIVSNYQAN